MPKILVTTAPFSSQSQVPLELLRRSGFDYEINPMGRKLTEAELAEMVADCDAIVAGTEPISRRVMDAAPRLRLVSRVGVGLDSVDLVAARERGISVAYTPEAPAPAVAELALGLMLTLLRNVHVANSQMHNCQWQRHFGRRLSEVRVGIIGAGRIGGRLIRLLEAFDPPEIMVCDRRGEIAELQSSAKIRRASKDEIYRLADLVSIHVPLTTETTGMVQECHLRSMKADAVIINTSRGGIIDEQALFRVLSEGHLYGAAIDVFDQEPYQGPLTAIERCLLTAHMGSMSLDCRVRMEVEATEDVIRFLSGEALRQPVPQDEFDLQMGKR